MLSPSIHRDNQTALDAIHEMSSRNVGSLVVLGEDGRTKGLLTKLDFLAHVAGEDKNPREVLISEFMTPAEDLVCVQPKDTVSTCLYILSHHRFGHLPVKDGENGDVIGIITSGDLIETVLKEAVERTDQLQRYIRGGYSR